MRDHSHPHGVRDFTDRSPDASEADDPHGFPGEFHQRRLPEAPVRTSAPLARPYRIGMHPHVVAVLQQEREYELRHGSGSIRGNVRDDDSLMPGRSDIYDV